MDIIVVSIHIAAAVILVLTVLLQAGKGSGMGAAFGGSSGTVFGARGPATLISKITCGAAVIFMITSLNLALSQGGASKKSSIMDDWSSSPAVSVPAPASPAAPDSMASPAPEAAPAITPEAAEAVPGETEAPAIMADPVAGPDEAPEAGSVETSPDAAEAEGQTQE
jgi:protein translocase, SecG subunit